MSRLYILVALILGQLLAASAMADTAAGITPEQLHRGSQLYARYCAMCHRADGQGAPPTFPPLAKSDFLAADKDRSARILITGLSGAINVLSEVYNGVMPPAPYNDEQLADVLTFVHNSFGNSNGPVFAAQVKKIHAQIATTNILADPNPFNPLPAAPAGFTLREVVRLPNYPTRMASDGKGKTLYILCQNADVWRVDLPGGNLHRILNGEDYAGPDANSLMCFGLMLDSQNRLYISANARRETQPYITNLVTIYRTTTVRDGEPAEPQPWLQTCYPFGISSFNHGVGHLALGPDGFIYASSGSRTDGGEAGGDPRYFGGGEVPLTACFWRLDPRAEHPEIEIFARGLRNPFGFCWNASGEMFATDNGPDANAPEELNLIERGKHYGFPYQFSNWEHSPYAYSPKPPPGLELTVPIANTGPDAGGSTTKPLFTFEAHSSPGGIVCLGDDFPPDYRGTFLITRYGNLLERPKDVGFDLLQVRLTKNPRGIYEAEVKELLTPLARPVDIHQCGPGKIYICEYTRVLDNSGKTAMLPGRLLELAVKK
jgi:glucose/arabinose dehydrogenase/mono/diheme cytochrome c family protein